MLLCNEISGTPGSAKSYNIVSGRICTIIRPNNFPLKFLNFREVNKKIVRNYGNQYSLATDELF